MTNATFHKSMTDDTLLIVSDEIALVFWIANTLPDLTGPINKRHNDSNDYALLGVRT
jgi:hypothetical protein